MESDLISGKKSEVKPENLAENELEGDSDNLDLDDLMEEMQDTINLETRDHMKLSSMHHFKLKPRDVV